MRGLTKDLLAAVASELLDGGGLEAVTLRAVAEKVGVSHNAPYRHFRDRSALLAGVARRDFEHLNRAFIEAREEEADAGKALRRALNAFVDYGLKHPARYRLLFSDPGLPDDPGLKTAAVECFTVFVRIVARCQEERVLPGADAVRMGGLIYAAAHGAIDLEIGGRASGEKGLGNVFDTVDYLMGLLTSKQTEAA